MTEAQTRLQRLYQLLVKAGLADATVDTMYLTLMADLAYLETLKKIK